jgi:lactose/L-arabinose transport system substrate-binding protein
MTMKKFWQSASAGVVALGVFALAQQGASQQSAPATDPINGNSSLRGEITVLSWAENEFTPALAGFNRIYPNIKVRFLTAGYTEVYPRLLSALERNEPIADVALVESEYVEQFASRFPNTFTDVTEWAAKYERDFDRAKWAQATYGGRLLGLPTSSAPVGFWYRADMFQKANVNPEDLDTWDQFVGAGAKVLEANPGVKLTYIDLNTETLLRTIVQQQGSFYINNAGEVSVNNAQVRQGLKVLKRLWDEKLLLPVNGVNGVIGAMKANRIAAVMLPVWNINLLKQFMPEQAGKWGVTVVPALGLGGGRAAAVGGGNLVIPSSSANKDLAWAWVEYYATQGIAESFKTLGSWPSYLPLVKRDIGDTRDAFFATPLAYQPFVEVSKRMRVFKYSSDFEKAKVTVAAAQRSVLEGGVRVDNALDKAATELSTQTKRQIAR